MLLRGGCRCYRCYKGSPSDYLAGGFYLAAPRWCVRLSERWFSGAGEECMLLWMDAGNFLSTKHTR
jgi:hypothetical protein